MKKNAEWPVFPWRHKKKSAKEKEHAPDYKSARLEPAQLLYYGLQGVLLTAVLAWFFYRSFWAMLPLSPILVLYCRQKGKELAEKKRQELAAEFKDLILSVAAGLQAGYSIENAFFEAGKDMKRLYGRKSLMFAEMEILKEGIRNHIALEQLLEDLGKRSGQPDVEDFAEVFAIARKTGGNLNEMIRKSAAMICGKMEVKREIRTLLSSRQYEQKIMNLVPFLIITYLQVTAKGFFDPLYHNPAGIAVMTAALAVYGAACLLSAKIVKIEV